MNLTSIDIVNNKRLIFIPDINLDTMPYNINYKYHLTK